MTDIDFDELDKAVNSLMNPSTSSATQQSAPVSSPTGAPTPVQAAPPVETTGVASIVTKRQSGRFMDIAHPSRDMTNRPAPSQSPSREAQDITPLPSSVADSDDTPTEPPQFAVQHTPDVSDMQRKIAESLAGDAVEPSVATPADDTNITSDIGTQPAGEGTPTPDTVDQQPEPASTDDSSTNFNIASPLDSPFRTDVVVEKRPLGSSQLDAPSDITPETEASTDPWAAEPTVPIKPVTSSPETATALAPELSSELMAVEAASVETPEVESGGDVASISTMAPVSNDQPNNDLATEPQASSLPGDIPAQYTAAPSSASEPGAIYDASSESQPIAHPAKKKSGWLTVVLIIVLLLIGAGGGVAAYFLLLQ